MRCRHERISALGRYLTEAAVRPTAARLAEPERTQTEIGESVFCSADGSHEYHVELERRLLKEWIAAKDLDWVRRFGLPMPTTLPDMLDLADTFGIDNGGFERLGRGRTVAFMEGRIEERMTDQRTGQADNKTDSQEKPGRFLDAPSDVRIAVKFLRENEKKAGSKKALLLQHTMSDEQRAERLAKATQPKRYGYLLRGTRFDRTTSGQSA